MPDAGCRMPDAGRRGYERPPGKRSFVQNNLQIQRRRGTIVPVGAGGLPSISQDFLRI